jgi:hypothetical protein
MCKKLWIPNFVIYCLDPREVYKDNEVQEVDRDLDYKT